MTFYEGKSQKVGFRLGEGEGAVRCTMYVLDPHNKGQIYKTTMHNMERGTDGDSNANN